MMRGVFLALALGVSLVACTASRGDVRGFQSGGGWSVMAENRVLSGSATSAGVLDGTSAYVGASVDGSVIGFLRSDGVIRWYRFS